MANTIQLRNSVVKDKAPLPSQLVIGEVCVGAHEDSPMLIFKDNADNIIKIEPGSGVTPSPDAPDSPSAGDLWFDTNTSLLYYYNGSAWVELGTAGDSPVTSVNSKVGAVVLNAADVGAVTIGDVNPTYFANQAAFPDAASPAVHGGVAHSHADGAMFFAHDGVWTELANASDVGQGYWEKSNDGYLKPKEADDVLWLESGPSGFPTMVWGEKQSTGNGGSLKYLYSSDLWRFNAVDDEPSGSGDNRVDITTDGQVMANKVNLALSRSSDPGTPGTTVLSAKTYSTETFTVDNVGKLFATTYDLESLDPLPA